MTDIRQKVGNGVESALISLLGTHCLKFYFDSPQEPDEIVSREGDGNLNWTRDYVLLKRHRLRLMLHIWITS